MEGVQSGVRGLTVEVFTPRRSKIDVNFKSHTPLSSWIESITSVESITVESIRTLTYSVTYSDSDEKGNVFP